MTVEELIVKLQALPNELQVLVKSQNMYVGQPVHIAAEGGRTENDPDIAAIILEF